MIRTSFRYWLMTLLLGPACALALEIGEIQVSSALNQLFDARIPLPTLTPEELGKITVKLAGPPMFKEFGLERTSALANLVFAIEYNAEGQVYVRVVSTQPIREPSLGLLLEFSWPRGKTFREFTVFLDPVLRLVKRPGGRIKAVMEPPANAVYGPESAAVPVSEPPPVAIAAAPEAVTPPVEWSVPPAPAIAPVLPPAPPPVKTYAPGDRYTVVPDESLWGIALKVRPDPGIAREQMMQALFRANPQAFSKVGITGLKVDVTLRIPTLREIADWTGSPVAKRLAEAGEIKPEPVPDSTTKVVATDEPQTFSLPPAPAPEPDPIAATPEPAPIAATPEPAPIAATPEPDPVAATPEPAPVAATPEPAPVAATPATAPKPETAETTPESEPVTATVEEQSSTQILEPVSATPLLFLAIAEMMAASTQIPVAVPAPAILPVVAPTTPEPNNETTVITHDPQPAESTESTESTGQSTEPPPTEPANPVAESPLVGKISEPAVIEIASLVADPPPVIEVVESPGVEVASPAVERLPSAEPTAVTAEPTGPLAESPPTASVDSAAPVVYKGGDLYGPVSSNERLWGIATKVRPDPTIGKDTMMRALFMANLQAFSKPGNMNSLKVGAMLRVPTLQEIADLAGSKVARQLLEQSSAVPAEATPAN
ncbi:MAG: LysM peptidoglycan-binding domain-containing protein [Candidatus Contendobacter sp.]|nr:LysM peptidoglycan-binding domain-containing protein [Candidatus Contendobacter sp.]